jgi:hypothetical protein
MASPMKVISMRAKAHPGKLNDSGRQPIALMHLFLQSIKIFEMN